MTARPERRASHAPVRLSQVLYYSVYVVIVVVTVTPFLMMVLGSFKQNYEIMTLTPRILPQNGFKFTMYSALFKAWPFLRNMLNSLFVSGAHTIGGTFLCGLAGFTFAKYRFPGRDRLFLILLLSMMVPLASTLVPSYLVVRALHGINTYWALIVPGLVPPFGVFLIRQYAYSGVPDDLIEAARMEGAKEGQIVFRIGFPIMMPALVSLVVLLFMQSWNTFLWPLVVVSLQQMFTVTVALRAIADPSLQAEYGMILAAATLSAIPILVVYFFAYRTMVRATLAGAGREL